MDNEPSLALKEAKAAFERRREASRRQVRIDNSALKAGAPIFFYCEGCDTNHATLREDYEVAPPHVCRDCRLLVELIQAAETPHAQPKESP